MNGFRVNEKKRVVTVYRLSLDEKDYKIIERYKALDYDVVMLEKKEPPKKTGIKSEELIKYLDNGNIAPEIYKEMKERLYKKQNFLRVKSWLITTLKDYADDKGKEYIPIAEIIKNAKEKENLEKEQNKGNKKLKENANKTKIAEIQQDTNKNK